MSSGKSLESGRSWERQDGVDLLRGLAIFLVLMNHINFRVLSADVLCANGIPEQIVSLVWNGQRRFGADQSDAARAMGETGLASWGRRRGGEGASPCESPRLYCLGGIPTQRPRRNRCATQPGTATIAASACRLRA